MKDRLILFALATLMVGCVSSPQAEVYGGYAGGDRFVVVESFAAQWEGGLLTLVPPAGTTSINPEPITIIQPGTRIAVTAIQSRDTITRGEERWAEGRIESGRMRGARISLSPDRFQTILKPIR